MASALTIKDYSLFGVGSYTTQEASRLLRTPALNISRWMRGYSYTHAGKLHTVPPLWETQWPLGDNRSLEIGFRDLIELRFVAAFLNAGMGLLSIRNCLNVARELVDDSHPFSTRRFRTDGRTIFLEITTKVAEENELLDLRRRQYAFSQVIERTFKDLDIDADTVTRWRPYNGKASIVIDPKRSFGQPIAADSGVPTIALAEAVEAEGSEERVARLFEVPLAVVRDAVRFEGGLVAA